MLLWKFYNSNNYCKTKTLQLKGCFGYQNDNWLIIRFMYKVLASLLLAVSLVGHKQPKDGLYRMYSMTFVCRNYQQYEYNTTYYTLSAYYWNKVSMPVHCYKYQGWIHRDYSTQIGVLKQKI